MIRKEKEEERNKLYYYYEIEVDLLKKINQEKYENYQQIIMQLK